LVAGGGFEPPTSGL